VKIEVFTILLVLQDLTTEYTDNTILAKTNKIVEIITPLKKQSYKIYP